MHQLHSPFGRHPISGVNIKANSGVTPLVIQEAAEGSMVLTDQFKAGQGAEALVFQVIRRPGNLGIVPGMYFLVAGRA